MIISESNQLESQGRSYYSLIHAKTVVSGQLGVKIVTVYILHGVAACILRGVEFFQISEMPPQSGADPVGQSL